MTGLRSIVAASQINLSPQTRVIGGFLALLFLTVLVELVRRHRLQERYTIAWFFAGMSLLVLVVVPDTLAFAARLIGVSDTNVALFALVLLAILGLLLNLTVVISRLHEQSTRLAQELAVERAARQAETRAIEEAVPEVRELLGHDDGRVDGQDTDDASARTGDNDALAR